MAGVSHGETPAYARVASALRERIRAGEFPPGARIPSRAEISATYGVGNTSALEALRLLTAEGLVEGRQGSGTFVRERRPGVQIVRHWHEGLGYTMPYTAAMAARPDTNPAWTVDTDTSVEATSVIAERLGIEAGARCVRSVYVFRMNDAVVMLYTSWEPHALTGGTPVLLPERGPLAGAGVPTRMAEIGYPVVRAVERLSARPALASEAVVLEVPTGTSLLTVTREWWTAERPVETADILIPGPHEVRYDLPTSR